MRVSAKAEYACIAMTELACNYREPQPMRVKSIAETHQIPQRFLMQILLQLKGAGLVVSIRGASGGYQLAKPPQEMSLADIINAIDRGSVPRPQSTDDPGSSAMRALRDIWNEVQKKEQRFLEEITLADMAQRTDSKNSFSYQI